MHMFQGVLSLALARLAIGMVKWQWTIPGTRLKLTGGTPFSSKFWDKSSKFSADSIVCGWLLIKFVGCFNSWTGIEAHSKASKTERQTVEILDVRWFVHLPILTTKRAGCYVYVTSHAHLSNQTEVQTAISGVIICYIPLPKLTSKSTFKTQIPDIMLQKKRHLQKKMQVNSKQYIQTQWFWEFSSICQHENPTPPCFCSIINSSTHPPHDFSRQPTTLSPTCRCWSVWASGLLLKWFLSKWSNLKGSQEI